MRAALPRDGLMGEGSTYCGFGEMHEMEGGLELVGGISTVGAIGDARNGAGG